MDQINFRFPKLDLLSLLLIYSEDPLGLPLLGAAGFEVEEASPSVRLEGPGRIKSDLFNFKPITKWSNVKSVYFTCVSSNST